MTDHTAPMETIAEQPRDTGRHQVNVGHLVLGVAFLGLFVVWALIASDAVEGEDVRWLMPIPWVAAGLAGVLASILPARRGPVGVRQTGWVTSPETTATTETTEEATEENPEENK